MKRYLIGLLVVLLLAATFTTVSAAPQGTSTVSYVVKPGDTLAKIARQYCTTWTEIYNLNRQVIGPNPNHLVPGTVLQVPNRCGGPNPGVCPYDRGPSQHAMGSVSGDRYRVVPGDTLFSISRRFGVPVQTLMTANHLPNSNVIFAGQVLIIPGLGGSCPPPNPQPQPYLRITSPQPGAVLPATFTVTGSGAGLFEGNVVIQAKNGSGTVLVQQATTLQGVDGGMGAEGTFSLQLTVSTPPGTSGTIVASSPQSPVTPYSVPVVFGAPSNDCKTYAPGQCQVQSLAGAPFYVYPGGPKAGQFGTSASYGAKQGAKVGGKYWYLLELEPGTGNPPVWAPASSLSSVSSGCQW